MPEPALLTPPPAAPPAAPAPAAPAPAAATQGATPSAPATPEPGAPTVALDDDTAACRRVVRVRFAGLARVNAEDIRGTVRSREGECLDRARASRDARALWDLGFFRDIRVSAERAEGGVELRFTMAERPTIHAIRYEGYDEVEEDKLRETVDLRDGTVLSETAVRRNRQKLIDLYAEKGFFLAEVTYRIEPRPGSRNEVDVVFHIVEHAQVQVRSLRFIGNNSLTDDELRGVMATGTANFFSFLTSAGNFREEAFRNDIDLLHAAYYDRGYLTVDIATPRVALSPDRQFIDISIPVREGPRFRIGRLRVIEVDDEGNEIEPLGGRRPLRERVHVNPGEWFSRSTIGRDIVGIQTYYRDAGYANVEVTPDIQPDTRNHVVDLTVRVTRGPIVTVGRIEIRGNTKTSERVIRREMQLIEGERYNETNYQASRRRIMALGYFERVDLSTEPVEGHPDRLVVNVEVAERPTGTFQIGAGFSSVENFIATAQIQQLNLFGRGQSLTLQAQLSGLRQIFSLRFVEPYFLDSNWTFALDLYNSLRAFTDFTRTGRGGTVTFGYPILGNDLRLFLNYTGEDVSVSTRTGTGLFGQNVTNSVFQSLPLANLFQAGFTSALGASMTYDTRDNRLTPTDGVFARLGVDVADPVFGSTNVYTRVTGWFRFYRPLFSGVVLRANLQGGYVSSRREQGVPIFERFFLGGIFDVRGYRLRTISPRLALNNGLDPNASVSTNGAAIGGNVQAYYNLEVEFPLLNAVGLRGVVFHDAGNVFNTEQQYCRAAGTGRPEVNDPCTSILSDPFALRYSVGFGLRWQSPLGLLRFEWGFPLNRLPYEESSVFEFTIGNFF
ncbi:MAG: outer membrane protein assembly factor BamA [Myxococcales bacterium]|nr:outer membrane protein assembly factor BamA [Myxococcales bacterium]